MSNGFVGSMSNSSSTAVTSITCDIHAAARPGDLGLWQIAGQTATGPSSNPSGWLTLSSGNTTGLNQVMYYRWLDGTETTTQTSGTLASARTATQMMILRGSSVANDVTGSNTAGTTATTFGSVTPTWPGSWVIAWAAQTFASGITPGTLSSTNLTNLTQVASTAGAAINVQCCFGTFEWTSGAFTPNMSVSTATTRTQTNRNAVRPSFIFIPPPPRNVPLMRAAVI